MMLDTEGQWSEALASNNIKAIICWLRKFTAEGYTDVGEITPAFSCWVQRTAEFAKKELLTLCFSCCQGLWMFLDRGSFTRVHMLLQKLRNLLTLAQWGRKHLCSAHLWHGAGVPCVICKDTYSSSEIRPGCWNREQRMLMQHIWVGQLVQWWGIMGLLPKFPETQEVKRITQMWKEMDHSHRKAGLETQGREEGEMGRFKSLIQSMVTQLCEQHGCIWMSGDCTDPRYPPPNLQTLLKLVLIPNIDNMSVQAILMYFILDVANFLQCKDDLLQAFCHAFTIPSTFSQQIRAFWMLDHGHTEASMELLLSPKASVPTLSWQHRCIIHCLLTRKQPQEALRYLQWARPAVETTDDAKLFADVLIQSSFNSDAWALLKRGHTETEDMSKYFLQTCKGVGLCTEALKYILVENNNEEDGAETTEVTRMKKEMPLCPLSAKLYRAQKAGKVSTDEQVKLVRKAVKEVRKPHSKLREVVWPERTEKKPNSKQMLLPTEALRLLTCSSLPVHMAIETQQTAHTADPEGEHPLIYTQQQQLETQENIFSSEEDLRSVSASSSTSASPLPLMKWDPLHTFKSTLTLQTISSLLRDRSSQSRGQEEHRPHSSAGVFLNIPELVLTPDGATEPISFSSLNKDSMVELMLSAHVGEDDEADVFLEEDTIGGDGLSRPSTYESLLSDTSFTEVAPTHCVQTKKPHQQEEPQGCSSQHLPCTPAETTHDMLTDLHQSLVLDWSIPRSSPGMDDKGPSLVLGQPYSYGLVNFLDFTAKQKGENRDGNQAEKDEPAGWSSSGKVSQGAIRSGRAGSRKGKRVKRA
ncbi:unnamed protein product [Oreochromis niloticus]|nr:unnamed protein product [Mustela putorius furo]